jgi:diguanylate cyclase (GGDEF)-like protein
MFAAADRGNTPLVLQIDGGHVDPAFAAISADVLGAAVQEHRVALAQLANLLRLESLSRWLTPIVFLAGLLLATLLASITRGHRRSLERERAIALHVSMHDALTGLPNRTLLADRFGQVLLAAGRSGISAGLLLLDLDRFKEINDTFGHHHGDELLTQIGPRLTGVLREVDTVARLGGDEFAVLLPQVATLVEATAVATKLRAALETPFSVEGVDFVVDASIGVVLSVDHGHDAATLLQRADVAMYVAKHQDLGVFAYDADLDAALGVRISIDDFGGGYTSLGQLKTLPITELKIDRSFVMTMTTDRSNALIVHSVVDLGHNLGLTIVAEGVEDAECLTVLHHLGCDSAQGYHLARPLPAHAFDEGTACTGAGAPSSWPRCRGTRNPHASDLRGSREPHGRRQAEAASIALAGLRPTSKRCRPGAVAYSLVVSPTGSPRVIHGAGRAAISSPVPSNGWA